MQHVHILLPDMPVSPIARDTSVDIVKGQAAPVVSRVPKVPDARTGHAHMVTMHTILVMMNDASKNEPVAKEA
jgi:hypothetical protein